MGKHTRKLLSRSTRKKQLREGKTCAITVDRPKTAALLFDHVYCSNKDIPYDLTPGWVRSPGGRIVIGGSANRALRFGPTAAELDEDIRLHGQSLMDFIAERGLRPVPYYETLESLDAIYAPGDAAFIGMALEDVVVVDESGLEWDQVVGFRQDEDVAQDYRRLVHWFDSNMKDKELAFVQDELAIRYEKYLSALKKHGLGNRMGELLSIWTTLQALGSVGIGTLIGSLTASPQLGVLAAFAMLDATTSAKVREIKRDDAHARKYGEFGELAFVHRINATAKPDIRRTR